MIEPVQMEMPSMTGYSRMLTCITLTPNSRYSIRKQKRISQSESTEVPTDIKLLDIITPYKV